MITGREKTKTGEAGVVVVVCVWGGVAWLVSVVSMRFFFPSALIPLGRETKQALAVAARSITFEMQPSPGVRVRPML